MRKKFTFYKLPKAIPDGASIFTVNAPSNLSASLTDTTEITLDWDAPEGNVDSYKVYRDGTHIDTVSSVGYVDSGLIGTTQYCYEVSAEYLGKESNKSNEACETTDKTGIVDLSNSGDWAVSNDNESWKDNFTFSSDKIAFGRSSANFVESMLVNTAIGEYTNVEAEAAFKLTHNSTQPAYIGLAIGVDPNQLAPDETGTGWVTSEGVNFPDMTFSVSRFSNGGQTFITSNGVVWLTRKVNQDEVIHTKLRHLNGSISTKFWVDGDSEPNWQFTESETISSGYVGIYVELEELFELQNLIVNAI